ncbi:MULTISPECIES: peroxide stress protein YaaA [Polaribacter]|uniref:UPF0246 protein BTO13_00435 n=1 Tax=Polaribacter gangjinensis TaxID=574710 RepID=A0A2S7W8V0_9FLAO|nr:peroxide stress protein YaaA [Polaribacter gangjinensis]PQJ73836.1 hypothetical protein BTO13_00435 [Polaribacter gangjinensis]
MKIIISPAKSLDFESKVPTSLHTMPRFLEQSAKLNQKLKTLSKNKLADLMSISDDLAALNYERNQTWQPPFSPENSKQAIYAFTGEVFRGIDVNTLPIEKLPLLQENLRILSGLYGILKPLDLMQPYRLEMGTKLKVGTKENLYKFWGDTIANALNEELLDDELLINLASSEYFKVINQKVLKVPMITPVFKDFKNGQYKTIMTFAKKARGLMVRYIIENNVKTIDELKHFDTENYRFDENMSSKNELVFTR